MNCSIRLSIRIELGFWMIFWMGFFATLEMVDGIFKDLSPFETSLVRIEMKLMKRNLQEGQHQPTGQENASEWWELDHSRVRPRHDDTGHLHGRPCWTAKRHVRRYVPSYRLDAEDVVQPRSTKLRSLRSIGSMETGFNSFLITSLKYIVDNEFDFLAILWGSTTNWQLIPVQLSNWLFDSVLSPWIEIKVKSCHVIRVNSINVSQIGRPPWIVRLRPLGPPLWNCLPRRQQTDVQLQRLFDDAADVVHHRAGSQLLHQLRQHRRSAIHHNTKGAHPLLRPANPARIDQVHLLLPR